MCEGRVASPHTDHMSRDRDTMEGLGRFYIMSFKIFRFNPSQIQRGKIDIPTNDVEIKYKQVDKREIKVIVLFHNS